MQRLLILKALSEVELASPEYRYQLAQLRAEASRVFPHVQLREVMGATDIGGAAAAEGVLLVPAGSFLLTASSLAALGQALLRGFEYAVPEALEHTPELASRPVYTRRGFEEIEAAVLTRQAGGQPPAPDLECAAAVPALLSAADFETSLAAGPREELLRQPAPALSRAGLHGAVAGLCHRFVDYYGERREDAAELIHPACRDVLEIGCARGATGAFLQETLGFRVTGVELNPAVAAVAAGRLHRVLTGDVLEVELEREFDVVLAFELFEHLMEPERFLEKARRWLRPGGRIILSVPNVGHYSVVEDLLAGRWDYLPIGLLCYTHYRFFTRRTLEDWLAAAGCHEFEIHAQKTELPERMLRLGELLDIDEDSLATKGFYVVIAAP